MAQMIDVQKVTVGPRYLTARVRIADGAPLTTDQDLVGTTLVYNLMPEICDHACIGDAGRTFKDALPATELAHLLEHVTVELIARTGMAGAVSCGQTAPVADADDRTFDVRLDCPDDVLVVAALSSAAWILQWAYTGGGDPEPGVEAIVSGIAGMVKSLDEQPAEAEAAPEEPVTDEPASEPAADAADAAAPANAAAPEPAEKNDEPEPVADDSADDAEQPVVDAADESAADDGYNPQQV